MKSLVSILAIGLMLSPFIGSIKSNSEDAASCIRTAERIWMAMCGKRYEESLALLKDQQDRNQVPGNKDNFQVMNTGRVQAMDSKNEIRQFEPYNGQPHIRNRVRWHVRSPGILNLANHKKPNQVARFLIELFNVHDLKIFRACCEFGCRIQDVTRTYCSQ